MFCKLCTKDVHQRGYCTSHYMKWYRGNLGPYFCKRCNEEMPDASANQKFCDECRVLQIKESSARHEHRRRDKTRAGVYYTRSDILDMDKGICYLCQQAVDSSFELEHIIPLSKGGSDIPENVAASHRSCNRLKGVLELKAVEVIFPNMILPERFERYDEVIRTTQRVG